MNRDTTTMPEDTAEQVRAKINCIAGDLIALEDVMHHTKEQYNGMLSSQRRLFVKLRNLIQDESE